MPKQTFFNLEREKKELLIQAAMKEFSRVPLFEASISNIIKDAGIPRGSFYQYFEDKEDVFFFLLNDHSKRD
ncbi:TetR/AcrR family transcriptional regulator, partial [Bacillus cereus]|nr:TetR/AcrR family transcriptional regulator [Bacillus cereus]